MKTFDWIIVGGGIAGISLSEILTREGHSVALIEKNSQLASETTKESAKILSNFIVLNLILSLLQISLAYFNSFMCLCP